MREIEFRGKTKDGEWVYGYLDYRDNQFFINEVFETPPTWQDPCGDTHYERHLIDHETIGQYTGLNDKNGNKIFEGDIVNFTIFDCFDCDTQYTGHVFYDVNYARFVIKFSNDCDDWFHIGTVVRQDDEIEIIGNIHDNQEMVKE